MAEAGGSEKVLRALRLARLTDSFSVLIKGNLAQRAVVLLGMAMIAFAVYRSWVWGAVILGGWFLCYLGLRDYERDRAVREEASNESGSSSESMQGGARDDGR